ncbi:MAG: YraN family protein [Flavihumibacter sp.]
MVHKIRANDMDKKGLGTKGELLAVQWLQQNGFTVLAQNWKAGRKEIDIIACRGNCLHFIEVKTRSSSAFGFGEEQVNRRKMKHIREAAQVYLEAHPQWQRIQFDAIAIEWNSELSFFEDLS